MIDVTAIGELIVDFVESGLSERENQLLEVTPGGAPCNLLSMLCNLGNSTAFIGKVGNDLFGNMLKNKIEEKGINTNNLILDENIKTTLLFSQTVKNGGKKCEYYRNPGADMMLREDEINMNLIKNSKIFHFGTMSMTHEEIRSVTIKTLEVAKENGCIISFAPNLRAVLRDDLENAKKQVEKGLEYCNILKISDKEIQWFTGEMDLSDGVQSIRSKYDIELIVVSMGKEGSRAYHDGIVIEANPFLTSKTIETAGAGDAFEACVLHFVLKYGMEELDRYSLRKMLNFANAAASIVTTRKGTLEVMPEIKEINALLQSR